MNKPKWYTLYLNCEWGHHKPGVSYNYSRTRFFKWVLYYILVTDFGMSRISAKNHLAIHLFCGEKKLNKIVQEIDRLGLTDNTIIF